MILSTMTLKYSDGDWTFARNGRKGLMEAKASAQSAEIKTLDRMTLSELLYHALMGDGMQAV